jgi:hypothetical protein
MVNDELKRRRNKRQWPNLRYYPGICLEVLRKITITSVMTAVSGPTFENGDFLIRSRSSTHRAAASIAVQSRNLMDSIATDI